MKLFWKLKKLLLLFLVLGIVSSPVSCVLASSKPPNLQSRSAILMESKTQKILFGKDENEKMYPASTTKIVTAILTLENCNLDDMVTVSYDAVMSIPDGYSSAFLQVGEQLTVEQLLQLLLVYSANDAANTLAEHVGGSVESFVSMMNTKVHELGLNHTHFTNAFGMHDDNHYTTAQDLAIIMKYCVQNEDFRRLSGKASCAIPATNKYGPRRFTSTNDLIVPNNKHYDPNLTCGKTGYTSQAGDCLVSCSYQNNLELICVILGGKTIADVSTRFSETKALYQFGYENYSIKTLLNQNDCVTSLTVKNGTKDTKNLDLLARTSIDALTQNSMSDPSFSPEINLVDKIKAPIEQGDILGTVSYTIDGITYKTDLIASHLVEKSKLLFYLIEIGGLILILFFIYGIFFRKKKTDVYEFRGF